jgi:hypothetical protein
MAGQPGSKLIWQEISPAPFESAWSIFAKLLALNAMSPSRVRSMIADPTHASGGELDFRDSSWIDFNRFCNALGVSENRLCAAFLDQLGFNNGESVSHQWYGPGIKLCQDCLAKGYHSVFFELGFVDICPWHYKKLDEPCDSCRFTVFRSGIKKRRDKSHEGISEITEWQELLSSCGHIHSNDGRVGKLNGLSPVEEEAVASRCSALLRWWRNVSKNPEIASFLSQYSFGDVKEIHLRAIFGAAEQIAGKCPWPVGISRGPVRTQRWVEAEYAAVDPVGDLAPRASEWDVVYRSVRRHIFSHYVRHHRDCWNELTSYRRYDARKLDSETCCPISLAYAVWRMHIERLRTIDALKSEKLKNHPIREMTIDWPQAANSLQARAGLAYAYFFRILEEILRHIGVDSFAIADSGVQWTHDFMTTLFAPDLGQSNANTGKGEWTLIFGEPKNLQRKVFVSCCGRPKRKYWMISNQLQVHWTDTHWRYDSDYGQPLFKLRKTDFGRRNVSYEYICI